MRRGRLQRHCHGYPRNCATPQRFHRLVSQTMNSLRNSLIVRFDPNDELVSADPLNPWSPKDWARLATPEFPGSPSIQVVSQRPCIWLPKCELVPQRDSSLVSRSKSPAEDIHPSFGFPRDELHLGTIHWPVARSMNCPAYSFSGCPVDEFALRRFHRTVARTMIPSRGRFRCPVARAAIRLGNAFTTSVARRNDRVLRP